MKITFELPIYKTKANKSYLVGLNWYRRVHYHQNNKIKKEYEQEIFFKLREARNSIKEPMKKYGIRYFLFYKRKDCDLMNVVSVIDKYVQDALQDCRIVANDSVEYCKAVNALVMMQDKKDPRVEVEVYEIKD